MKTHLLSENIKNLARNIGLDAVGFAAANEFSGYLLEDHPRRDPKLTLPQAKSIVVAGIYIGGVTMPEWKNPWYGRTSRLYLSGFFLDVAKPLEPLAALLKKEGYQARICRGSQPGGSILPLKLAAVRAGLGWQGKHALLISKKYGTFLALGGIITDAELDHNREESPNRCHKCTRCQDVCPVGALETPYVLDKSRCMSYRLSHETLPTEVRAVMENRIADCEICQEACPWNHKHLTRPLETPMTPYFRRHIEAWGDAFNLANLEKLTESDYDRLFGALDIDIAYGVFRRNVLLAKQNADKGTA